MPKRRGSLLVELGAALTLVAIASIMLLQLLQAVARQKRATQQQAVATQAIANALEEHLGRPYEAIVSQEQLDLPEEVKALLFEVEAKLDVAETAADGDVPATKQLVVSLRWTPPLGITETSRLVAWRSNIQEASE